MGAPGVGSRVPAGLAWQTQPPMNPVPTPSLSRTSYSCATRSRNVCRWGRRRTDTMCRREPTSTGKVKSAGTHIMWGRAEQRAENCGQAAAAAKSAASTSLQAAPAYPAARGERLAALRWGAGSRGQRAAAAAAPHLGGSSHPAWSAPGSHPGPAPASSACCAASSCRHNSRRRAGQGGQG